MDEGSGKSGGLGGDSEHLEVVVGGRAEAMGRAAWSPTRPASRRKIKIFGVHPGTVKAGLRSHHVSCDALEFGKGQEVVDERTRCGKQWDLHRKGMEVNVT